jgi:hypothetical protein
MVRPADGSATLIAAPKIVKKKAYRPH